ncbi:MAG: ATP-dependent helicase, partial [Candidatus Taylorbacteria bacterium]|nr:ATP-dependent helicase [Candidatus Taylorbacteria bacterium]
MPINKKKQDSSAFDSSYKSLNAKQKEAVDTIEGPVVVIAGPGTGKTTILTLRIANILRLTDTAPENILAMTFTESGAHAMRRKLTEIIGPAAYKVNIHTFHGFAAHVIEQYPDYFPGIIGSTIITELEKVKIIEEILKSDKVKLLRPYGDQAYYIGPILREIQILKRENVSPKQLMDDQNLVMGSLLGMESAGVNELKSSSKGSKSSNAKSKAVGIGSRSSTIKQEAVSSHQTINGKGSDNLKKTDIDRLKKQTEKNLELAFVYDSYEKKLAKKKYYDFEDMLLRLIQAMEEDKNFKLMLQESYHYILADEHQDANASQNRILELLADFHDSPNLFIVGDDKQAIYRFQGASLDNFLYFSKKYRDAVVIDLEHNYRSHQGILDASHSLISKNPTIPGYERKKLLSLQMGSMPILITECSTVNDELELVARAIERLLSKNILGHEIAVLYRDNKHAKPLSDVLRSHGIAHKIESDNDLLRELDVAKIIMLCKAMHDPSDNEALASALFLKELRCDPVEVAALCNLASRERKPLFESIMRSVGSDIKVAYQRIINWSQESRIIPFANFLQRLIQEMWILSSIVADPDSLERLNTLQAFFDHIASAAQSKRSFYLDDFIEYIDLAREHGLNGKPDHSERVGGVRLMTAHRAKGLEFSHVFIIHVVDGIWGNRSARNLFTIPLIEHARNTGRIEDERRLLYVAMTRARDSVHVTYSRNNGEKDLL